MTQGNMGLWDKIVSNCRQYEDAMRAQWREPQWQSADPIAGQRDVMPGRVSLAPGALRDTSVRAWRRGRRM